MFRRKREQESGERIPIYKPAECMGEACEYFTGEACASRLELLEASGESGEKGKAPLREDCKYALYGQVCMGGEQQVVIRLHAESPNEKASAMELVARMGRLDDQHIVLNTPAEAINFQ
jgi:hypothetical protein